MGAEMGPGPDVEHHHHHHTGHRWLDVTLGVSAVFISLMSLLLAIQHGNAMEKMVEVTSWPYVMAEYSNANADGSPRFAMWVINKGVGPAKIESIEIFYDGVAQPGAKQLVRAMLKIDDPNRKIGHISSGVVASVLSAREQVNLFDILPGQLSPEEYLALHRESVKLEARVCYCSVFDECWMKDEHKRRTPESVKACPVPKTMFEEG
jgi:hypothetical protein